MAFLSASWSQLAAWILKDQNVMRLVMFFAAGGGMALAVHAVEAPEGAAALDRVLLYAFVAFVVGLGELFLLLILLALYNRINLAAALQDKAHAPHDEDDSSHKGDNPGGASSAPPPKLGKSVSLSRLQALLWTLVLLVLYFHEAVQRRFEGRDGLPTVSADMLLLMGLSSAVYLTRQMRAEKEAKA
jgi:hypothetical protein